MIRDAFELAKEKAKDRGGAIIFIDEIDAIGSKRHDGDQSGEREVQRTMLELLNQLDGFATSEQIKVIAATNRPDILDPALMRSGRLDRKIELPHPTEEARARVLKIHARKMTVDMNGTYRFRCVLAQLWRCGNCVGNDSIEACGVELSRTAGSVRQVQDAASKQILCFSSSPCVLCSDVNFEELARSTEDFNCAMLKAVCVEAGMIGLRRDATILKHEDFMEGISAVQMKKKQSLQYYA